MTTRSRTLLRLMAGCASAPLCIGAASAQDSYQLNEIVITASGFAQQITDAPATISVISAEDIEGKSYTNITEVLDDIPGISIETSGSGKLPGASSINMRGLGESYILFLVDGKPIGDSQDAYYNGWGSGQRLQTLPPPSAIERIEVIRGPMSSLYGSSASGGVINIITKKTADIWSGTLTYGRTLQEDGASGDATQIDYYLTGPIIKDRLGFTFYGARNERDPDSFDGGASGVERDSNAVRLNWVMSGNQDLEFELRKTVQDTTRDPSMDSTLTEDKLVRTTRLDTALTHHYLWDNGFDTTSFLTHEKVDIDEGTNLSTHWMLNFNTRTLMSFGAHRVTAGFDYKLENTEHDADRFPGSISTDLERWHASLFAEDEFAITPDLTLTFGGRVDQNEKFGSQATPRIYAVYQMTDTLTLKGGISGGYTVPALKRTDDGIVEQAGRGRGWDQGNSDLVPEKSTNFEIGTIWQPTSDLQLGLTAYHTDFTDKIGKEYVCESPDPAVPSCTYNGETREWIQQYVNIDAAEIRGIEATLDYRLGEFDFSANYTLSDSEITEGANVGDPLNALPKHMVNLGVDWDATETLGFWVDAKYKSETNEVLAGERTPGYAIIDLGASYDFNANVRGFFNVYNAADKQITSEEYGSLLDGRRFHLGLTTTF